MSDHLKAFLTAWVEWVDAGSVQDQPFSRAVGLCCNFEDWLMVEHDFTWMKAEYEVDALKNRFSSDGLDRFYPFGGKDLYCVQLEHAEQHLNEARIAWVRSKVAQHETA
jgi:hypothetical protein